MNSGKQLSWIGTNGLMRLLRKTAAPAAPAAFFRRSLLTRLSATVVTKPLPTQTGHSLEWGAFIVPP